MTIAARPFLYRYGVAILSFVVCVLVVVMFPPFVQRGAFVLFCGAVVVSSQYGGWKPAVLTVALCTLSGAWFIMPPYNSLWVNDPNDVARLLLFVAVSAVTCVAYETRERSRRELAQFQQRFNLAMECADMGVWETNLKTGEFWWSPGVEKIFGRPPGTFSSTYEQFIGYVHPDDRDFTERATRRAIKNGIDFEIEHRIVRPDQRVCWIMTRGRVFQDDQGRATRIVGVIADITSKKTPAGLDAA